VLCKNGLFLNFDVVLPTSEVSEKIQFQMWVDWINETLQKNNLTAEVGKFNDLPNIYKSKEENKPSDLFDQLDLLTKAGYKDVDCFFKYSIFALFGGRK
jgi:tRNA (cmo5U34)-methyltransferase